MQSARYFPNNNIVSTGCQRNGKKYNRRTEARINLKQMFRAPVIVDIVNYEYKVESI